LDAPAVNVLFVHQNFPGQYVHVAGRLAQSGHRVVGITQSRNPVPDGVQRMEYAPARATAAVHAYLGEMDAAVRNAVAVARVCERLRSDGFVPDLAIGHSGWGETLYVKDVWPGVPLLGYFEFFYQPAGSDADFDAEFPPPADSAMRLRTRNAVNLLGLEAADWGQTPTRWQRDQYPARHRDRISIIHEGIDTEVFRPDPAARLWLSGGRSFQSGDEIVTYSARNLEPYRGFHAFMRALPRVLRRRPSAHCVIVGGDGVSYGRPPLGAGTWREQLLAELEGQLDLERVHFVGNLTFRQYLTVLQLSAVHVYLTYPFVLSWSLLEALATGCHVIGSRTPPVEEVIVDGQNGELVDFFDTDGLADRICAGLRDGADQRRLRMAARDSICRRYDLRTICLPAQLALLQHLAGRPGIVPAAAMAPQARNRPGVGFER
jgi:glycosyltransferase involved in cell wall biosynthesis